MIQLVGEGYQMIKYQAGLQVATLYLDYETGKCDLCKLGVGWSDEGAAIKIKGVKIPMNP